MQASFIYFPKKYLTDLQGDFRSVIFFKIGLTTAALACFKYLFEDISLSIKLVE